MHDDAVPFVTQRMEILCRPLANGPYLVASVDIFQQCPLAALLKRFGANHIGNINIKLGVIGQHQRHVQHLPQFPGYHGRHDGAVCMEQADGVGFQLSQQLWREGDTCHIAGFFPQVQAGITENRIGVAAVLVIRAIRRDDYTGFTAIMEAPGIIHHGVGYPVDDGWKGVIEQADGLFHTCHLGLSESTLGYHIPVRNVNGNIAPSGRPWPPDIRRSHGL